MHFCAQNCYVALEDTKYMISKTLTTYMPQYHTFILTREKMGISVHIKFMSPLKFECDYNALMYLEMEILCPTPSVM